MKWQEDLVEDIRTGTIHDNVDEGQAQYHGEQGEFTEANRIVLTDKFLNIRDNCSAILEIGVCRNHEKSSTYCFLNNKKDSTIYVGIDLEDKSFLQDIDKNIYTFQTNSSHIDNNLELFKNLNIEKFDFIFIDGWHSINQVLIDWEYTRLLSDHGIVGFHDTNYHPGPLAFMNAIDTNKWHVEDNLCPNDYGIGFVRRK